MLDALDQLLPTAAHPMAVEREMRYRAEPIGVGGGAGWEIVEDGDLLGSADDLTGARDLIHQRAHRRSFELAARKGWVRLHGALLDLAGARVLLVGPSGAGKTTLAVRLMLDGATFQGDESVLVRQGRALAVPRPLHLKPGTVEQFPELRHVGSALPQAGEVTVIDPARHLDRDWRLTERPIDHLVLLGNGPGPVRCTPVGPTAALPRLVPELFPLIETKAALLAALTELVNQAEVCELAIGPLEAMSDELLSLAGRP